MQFISLLSEELKYKTAFCETFKQIDESGIGLITSVAFEDIGDINSPSKL